MVEMLQEYRRKPWPKLEVPYVRSRQLIALVVYTIMLIAAGWLIWSSPETRVIQFVFLSLAIPVLFIVKSPFTILIGLLSFEVIVSFLFMGNPGFALATVAALVGAIIAFESPIVMYILLILAVWFDSSLLAGNFTNRGKFIVGTALLIGWLFHALSHPQEKEKKIYFPEKLPALFLLGWIGCGFAFWCLNPFPIGWMQLKFLIIGVLALMISPLVLRTEKLLNVAIWGWIGAGVIASLATLYALKMGYGPGAATQEASSISLLTGYKNVTATFLTFSFYFVLAGCYWMKGFKGKVGMLTILGLISATIFFLQSRGAMGGLVLGLGIFWLGDTFFSRQKSNSLRLLARSFAFVSLIALILIIIFYFDVAEFLQGYNEIFAFSTSSSIEFRKQMLAMSSDIISKEGHLIRGLGIGAFMAIGSFYGSPYGFGTEQSIESMGLAFNPHSIYLDILLHYGVIGLLLFAWLILLNLTRIWRNFRVAQTAHFRYLFLAIFCCLIGYYVHGLLDGQLYTLVDLWLYIGLAAAANNIFLHLPRSNTGAVIKV